MKLVTRFAAFAVVVWLASGCSNKPPAEQHKEAVASPADEPRPAAPASASAPPPPAAADPAHSTDIPADFPPECVDYAALIGKLRACNKLGQARDGLTQGYESLRSAWPMIPADQRATVGAQCKTQADSLRSAAAATCGW